MSFYGPMFDAITRTQQEQGNDYTTKQLIQNMVGEVGEYQDTDQYHVSTLYADRGAIGDSIRDTPNLKQAVARTASVLSGIPTHELQGANYGDNGQAFHIITKKTADKTGRALHALNTATLQGMMFYPEDQLRDPVNGAANMMFNSSQGKGYLENVTELNNRMKRHTSDVPLTKQDKQLMYLGQFTGTLDVYGDNHGYDFNTYINHDPGAYQDINMRRRWKAPMKMLSDAFGTDVYDDNIHQQAMRTQQGALTSYNTMYAADGPTVDRTNGRVLSFGNAHDRVLSYLRNTAQSATMSNMLQMADSETLFTDVMNAPSDSENVVPPRAQSTEAPTTAPPETQRRATPSVDTGAHAYSTTTTNTDTSATNDRAHRTGVIEASAPVLDLMRGHTGAEYVDTFVRAGDNVANRPHVEINRAAIAPISDATFETLERHYAIGGIESRHGSPGQVTATERSINALSKIRSVLSDTQGLAEDAKFYERVGNNALPRNSFDIRNVDPATVQGAVKKRLTMGGALVGINEDGTQKWLVDDVGQTALNQSSVNGNPDPAHWQRDSFTVGNAPLPDIDMDHRNWELLNTTMSMDDAVGNGYVVPIKNNKAIFVPSFAAPDFTYGVELEVGDVSNSMDDVLDKVRNKYGYDLTKLGFQGNMKSERDPSIAGWGNEYISSVMSGVRAFKATYMLGEVLKDMGGDVAMHRGERNDPSGIHINMGAVHSTKREGAMKFMADYLRLTEDVFKKVTSPDKRYRYSARQHSWPHTHGIVPNTMTRDVDMSNRDSARQFWSQSISKKRMSSDPGVNEYEFLRNKGKFYHNLEGMKQYKERPGYDSYSRRGMGYDDSISAQDAYELKADGTYAQHNDGAYRRESDGSYTFNPGERYELDNKGRRKYVLKAKTDAHRLAKYKTVALHKLQMQGVLEVRSPMYQPGGDVALAHLAMSSKLGADIHQGAQSGAIAKTDKLVPPVNGWSQRTRGVFNDVVSSVFGIDNRADQRYMWDFYQQCKAS